MKQITFIPAASSTNKTLRVAVYCRVSTPLDSQQLSLDTQSGHYEDMISCHPNWIHAGTYVDVASGTNRYKRPQFNAMIEACKRHEIDLILTKSISRIARNAVDALEVFNDLKLLGIDIYFENESLWLQKQTSMLAISLIAGVAQEESVDKSNNIQWGIHTRFQLGTSKLANRLCYGYQKGKDGSLCIHPEHAAVVKRIFHLYLEGFSLSRISKALLESATSSPTGKEIWTSASIDKLLSNEKYAGNVLLQKTYITNYWKHQQGKNEGQQPQYVYDNNNPPIIPPSVFEAVQQEKERRSNTSQNRRGKTVRKDSRFSSGNSLSGKIVCGTCNRNYRRITTHSGELVWRCAGRVEKNKNKCDAQTIKQQTITDEIMRQASIVDLHLDFLFQAVKQITVHGGELQVTMHQLDAVKKMELLHLQDHWLRHHCINGDQKAWEALYSLYNPMLKKRLYFLKCISPLNQEDIEDMEQMVWLQVFTRMQTYNSQYRFWNWMKFMIRREFQRSNRVKRSLPSTAFSDEVLHSSAMQNNIDSWHSDEYVQLLLSDLTKMEYMIVTRYLFIGDTQLSIARETGLCKQRISQIYHEALEKIKKRI